MKSIFGGSALIAIALLAAFLNISARPLAAETLFSHLSQQMNRAAVEASLFEESNGAIGLIVGAASGKAMPSSSADLSPATAMPYVATAYSLRGRTASGRLVAKGFIAADPRVLPLGSRVRLEAGSYSGEYVVADTGGAVRGRRIDIWTPTTREALTFGRRLVKLTVLSYGARRSRNRARA